MSFYFSLRLFERSLLLLLFHAFALIFAIFFLMNFRYTPPLPFAFSLAFLHAILLPSLLLICCRHEFLCCHCFLLIFAPVTPRLSCHAPYSPFPLFHFRAGFAFLLPIICYTIATLRFQLFFLDFFHHFRFIIATMILFS